MIRFDSASPHGASFDVPKFMAPRQARLTLSTDLPRLTYSINPNFVYIAVRGKIHMGDVQARSCSVGSFSARNGRSNRIASHVDHRQVGFSSART